MISRLTISIQKIKFNQDSLKKLYNFANKKVKNKFKEKNILNFKKDIQIKKSNIEKEIENEITKAQKEISELKKNSISDIQNISKDIASNIIENISGDKLNESSIKAAVEDVSKNNIGKYL